MIGLLNLLILTPILANLIIIFMIKNKENNFEKMKFISLIAQLINIILTFLLYKKFDLNIGNFQLEEKISFGKIFFLNYHLAIDGISLIFVILTNILMPIILIANWQFVNVRIKEYVICLLTLHSLILGSFLVIDLAVFYFFFELMLVPMYIIIGIWGGENKIFAATQFFLYTLTGSILLLITIIFIYNKIGSLDYPDLLELPNKLPNEINQILWFALFISFAVKVPMFPLHSWLPDAHVQAPTSGSMILAGILLKIGGYAMIRFLLAIFPSISYANSNFVINMSVIAVIYTSFVAFAQKDMKKTIAYSSIAHMGYVTAGIFAMNIEALSGAIIQMFSHGIISACLFFIVGIIYEKLHTKKIEELGSIARFAPNLAIMALIATMGSVALPGTSGFVGEILILLGIYKISPIYVVYIGSAMILGACYMLNLYRKVFYGEIVPQQVLRMNDINKRELSIFIFFILLIIFIGIYPNFLLEIIDKSLLDQLNKIGK